jgi:hypothetical protein
MGIYRLPNPNPTQHSPLLQTCLVSHFPVINQKPQALEITCGMQ